MSSPEEPKAVISELSLKRRQSQHNKRRDYFLKGPISFGWIQDNIPDPTSRVILVAQAFMDMAGSTECVLTAKTWKCAGVTDRHQRTRILKRIREKVAGFSVRDRLGRPSVLCVQQDSK